MVCHCNGCSIVQVIHFNAPTNHIYLLTKKHQPPTMMVYNSYRYSPSLRFSLAKPGPWLPDNCEELLKDDGSRLDTSGL